MKLRKREKFSRPLEKVANLKRQRAFGHNNKLWNFTLGSKRVCHRCSKQFTPDYKYQIYCRRCRNSDDSFSFAEWRPNVYHTQNAAKHDTPRAECSWMERIESTLLAAMFVVFSMSQLSLGKEIPKVPVDCFEVYPSEKIERCLGPAIKNAFLKQSNNKSKHRFWKNGAPKINVVTRGKNPQGLKSKMKKGS